jgi:hypothetical protein
VSKILTVVLPKDTEARIATDLSGELRGLEGVLNAGTTASRSLEVAALAVWIALPEVVNLAKTALELVQRIIDLVKGRGIQGVTIELPNGAKIAVDHASPADIQKIVGALKD